MIGIKCIVVTTDRDWDTGMITVAHYGPFANYELARYFVQTVAPVQHVILPLIPVE